VRGTWREGSYAEGFERHVMEGSGHRAVLEASKRGNLRHLAKEDSANMFIGLGCCPLTGYNPGLLLASLLDITP